MAVHRSGEIRDCSSEALSNRASGINVLVAIITTWNTVAFVPVADFVTLHGMPEADPAAALAGMSGPLIAVFAEHVPVTGTDNGSEVLPPGRARYQFDC